MDPSFVGILRQLVAKIQDISEKLMHNSNMKIVACICGG
jgi:hypothetical protein